MIREREFLWYLLINLPGFGAKSIHYIYGQLLANNMTIDNLFALNVNELYYYFPEIGKGKFSKISFSSFSELKNNQFEKNYLALKQDSVSIIAIDDARYPSSVKKHMQDSAPLVLYCKGQDFLLQ